MRVVKTDGSELGKLEFGFNPKDLVLVLPAAGDYALEVTGNNNNGMNYNLQAGISAWAPVAPTFGTDGSLTAVYNYKVVLDSQGRFVVMYLSTGRVDQKPRIGLQRFEGTTWTAPVTELVLGYLANKCADFVLDKDNNPVVVYPSPKAFFVQRWKPGGWQAVGANAGKLPKVGQYGNNCQAPPTLEIGTDGQPIVAYTIDGLAYVQHFDGANWVGLGPNDGNLSGSSLVVAMVMTLDSSGNPVVIWRHYQTSDSYALRYKSSPISAWEAIGPNNGLLPIPSGSVDFSPTALILDASGNPVTAGNASICSTTSGCGVFYSGVGAYRFDGSTWQPSGGHTALPSNYISGGHGPVSLLLNSDTPLLAWDEGSSNSPIDTYVQSWGGSSTWTGLGSASGALGAPQFSYPNLFKDASGNILMSLKGRVNTTSSSYQILEIYGYIP